MTAAQEWLGEDFVEVVTELAQDVTAKVKHTTDKALPRNAIVPSTTEERKSLLDSQYSRPELKEMEKVLTSSDTSYLREIFKLKCPNCDSEDEVEPRYRQRPPLPLVCLTFFCCAHLHDKPLHHGPALKFTCRGCNVENGQCFVSKCADCDQ